MTLRRSAVRGWIGMSILGAGELGLEVFRALLNDRRLKDAAFIAETPIDDAGDDLRNVEALKELVARRHSRKR